MATKEFKSQKIEYYKNTTEISYDKNKIITYKNISSSNWVLAKVKYEDGITDVIFAFYLFKFKIY